MLFREYEYGRFTYWKVKDICKWMDEGFDEIIWIVGDAAREHEIREKGYADFYNRHVYNN